MLHKGVDFWNIFICDPTKTKQKNSIIFFRTTFVYLFPATINLFKVNNRNNTKVCNICLKTLERRPDFVVLCLLLILSIFKIFC